MRGTLLAWGSALFLVRYERGALQLQRVDVNAGKKSVALLPCSVQDGASSTPLPGDARLLAAREVEDEELAMYGHPGRFTDRWRVVWMPLTFIYVDVLLVLGSRYPVLVFLSTGGPTAASTNRATRKRRRSANGSETPAAAAVTASPSPGVHSRLFFFVLCEARDDTEKGGRVHMRFLNVLDLPVCPTDEQQDALSTGAMTRICRYLPTFSSIDTDNERPLSLEQVNCCCFISESSDWDFTTASSSDPGRSIVWPSEVTARPKRVELTASTLLVVGSTSNTVYVYTNGILLVSFVLPVAPAEIRAVASATSTTTQVLLLNDVPAVVGTGDSLIKEGDSDNPDDGQLVKRSVLVVQQSGAAETKLVSYRLRLREQKKSKQSSRTLKRRSNGDKASLATSEGVAKTPFLYIERTQKASSRGKNSLDQLDESGGDAADSSAASHAQLGKLAESLATRLDKGLQELERMQLIVDDKHALTQQLNQLVLQQWWQSRQQTDTATDFVRLVSSRGNSDGLAESRGLVDMQTIVSTPSTTPTVGSVDATEAEPPIPPCDVVLESKVTLESFRVTEYVPSSSLVRVEVVLRNESAASLANAFVALTAPRSGQTGTQGWTCSSSVLEAFAGSGSHSLSPEEPSVARFQLELQFASTFTFLRTRKALEATLWLHWSVPHDDSVRFTASAKRAMAFAIASVRFGPDDLLKATAATRGGCSSFIQQAGERPCRLLQPVVVRPTFALVNLMVGERELTFYEWSRVVAALPPDVYAMHSPLERSHLRLLQEALRAMRLEILTIQRRATVSTTNDADPKASKQSVADEGDHVDSPPGRSIRTHCRLMQRDTDVLVLRLLQTLQKRVNFHTMWFDTAATDHEGHEA
ncbi:hypothetical protein BBJ28_00001409 [Nothophytophthora sp. Chile5]|nr:hypothetical protein BBJ28_00001409 [Nothophytophthora sp. Chile5]